MVLVRELPLMAHEANALLAVEDPCDQRQGAHDPAKHRPGGAPGSSCNRHGQGDEADDESYNLAALRQWIDGDTSVTGWACPVRAAPRLTRELRNRIDWAHTGQGLSTSRRYVGGVWVPGTRSSGARERHKMRSTHHRIGRDLPGSRCEDRKDNDDQKRPRHCSLWTGLGVRRGTGMTAPGQGRWWMTQVVTDPDTAPRNPRWPRSPTTIRSAAAARSTRWGRPSLCQILGETDPADRLRPRPETLLLRTCRVRPGAGPSTCWPLTLVADRRWLPDPMAVRSAESGAKSKRPPSTAAELSDPSTPTTTR